MVNQWATAGSREWRSALADRPKTRKICDKKNFLDKIWWFCENLELVKFEILNPKISKFEILNPNTKISNLDTTFLNFGDFCYKFEEKFAEIEKIGDISKFEILNPKITKLSKLDQKFTKIKISHGGSS